MKLKERQSEYRAALLHYVFRLIPIKKRKVVLCNYNGKGYGCNPKYIAEEMRRQGNWEMVWLIDNMEDTSVPSDIKKVKYNSVKSVYELATAGVWIDNQRKLWYHRKRKRQYFLETWHGAGIPMKKIGADNPCNLNNKPYKHTSLHMNRIVNLMICNSVACTEIFHRAFLYEGEILECGYPRNDLLINPQEEIRDKVYGFLDLSKEAKTVLYAPTYRKGRSLDKYQLEAELLLESLKKKFGGQWKVLLRLHPTMRQKAESMIKANSNVINASLYEDMQELLAACDILISDYSSIITEFALTGKPVFLFAEDVKDYAMKRDFYTDYYTLPFPIAQNNTELEQCIVEFNEESYKQKVKAFLEEVGIREFGTAAATVVERIEEGIR